MCVLVVKVSHLFFPPTICRMLAHGQHLAARDKTWSMPTTRELVHTGLITLLQSSVHLCSCFFTLAECTLMESHHGQVDVGGVQLQVDLPVDGGLAVLVEVLSHLRSHFSGPTKTSKSWWLHCVLQCYTKRIQHRIKWGPTALVHIRQQP